MQFHPRLSQLLSSGDLARITNLAEIAETNVTYDTSSRRWALAVAPRPEDGDTFSKLTYFALTDDEVVPAIREAWGKVAHAVLTAPGQIDPDTVNALTHTIPIKADHQHLTKHWLPTTNPDEWESITLFDEWILANGVLTRVHGPVRLMCYGKDIQLFSPAGTQLYVGPPRAVPAPDGHAPVEHNSAEYGYPTPSRLGIRVNAFLKGAVILLLISGAVLLLGYFFKHYFWHVVFGFVIVGFVSSTIGALVSD